MQSVLMVIALLKKKGLPIMTAAELEMKNASVEAWASRWGGVK